MLFILLLTNMVKLIQTFKLTYKLFTIVSVQQMTKLIPYENRNLCRSSWKASWPRNHARSETVQRFFPTPFLHYPLVLHTWHDLLRNKETPCSLKYHMFILILFTDLFQSLSSSWLKWLVLDQFTATSCSQRIRLEIPTSCSVLFSLFRLDPERPKSNIRIWDHVNNMM